MISVSVSSPCRALLGPCPHAVLSLQAQPIRVHFSAKSFVLACLSVKFSLFS